MANGGNNGVVMISNEAVLRWLLIMWQCYENDMMKGKMTNNENGVMASAEIIINDNEATKNQKWYGVIKPAKMKWKPISNA